MKYNISFYDKVRSKTFMFHFFNGLLNTTKLFCFLILLSVFGFLDFWSVIFHWNFPMFMSSFFSVLFHGPFHLFYVFELWLYTFYISKTSSFILLSFMLSLYMWLKAINFISILFILQNEYPRIKSFN